MKYEELAHRIAPNEPVLSVPLYVVLASHLPPESRIPFSFTSPVAASGLRDFIPNYEFPSQGIYIADASETDGWSSVEAFLHELAHILELQYQPRKMRGLKTEKSSEYLAASYTNFTEERQNGETYLDAPFWIHHGMEFTRVLYHILYRADCLLKMNFSLHDAHRYFDDVFASYELEQCLGNEPRQLADATFVEIMNHPMPDRYFQRFKKLMITT